MKNYLWLVVLSCSFLLTSFTPPRVSYGTGMEIEDIVGALKAGNATQLSRYFDIRVDITLPDKSDNYSRTQAEMVIRDFFSYNNVRSFEIKYKGENNGSKYCIGTLKTKNGDYRTKLFMKQKDTKQVLQEIAFQTAE
ncbi:MAG: DUF4783 domain-containing protein [Chitinophagaceae bacterium]